MGQCDETAQPFSSQTTCGRVDGNECFHEMTVRSAYACVGPDSYLTENTSDSISIITIIIIAVIMVIISLNCIAFCICYVHKKRRRNNNLLPVKMDNKYPVNNYYNQQQNVQQPQQAPPEIYQNNTNVPTKSPISSYSQMEGGYTNQ